MERVSDISTAVDGVVTTMHTNDISIISANSAVLV